MLSGSHRAGPPHADRASLQLDRATMRTGPPLCQPRPDQARADPDAARAAQSGPVHLGCWTGPRLAWATSDFWPGSPLVRVDPAVDRTTQLARTSSGAGPGHEWPRPRPTSGPGHSWPGSLRPGPGHRLARTTPDWPGSPLARATPTLARAGQGGPDSTHLDWTGGPGSLTAPSRINAPVPRGTAASTRATIVLSRGTSPASCHRKLGPRYRAGCVTAVLGRATTAGCDN